MNNLFIIKRVEFDSQSEDSFGFDDFVEKLSNKYIPFSSLTRKPIYLFFVKYVNYLLENGKINLSAKLKKQEVQLRLEKLLVVCWKNKNAIRGKSIIGNSIQNINPFIGKDGNWVIQNAFRVYNSSSNNISSEMIENYIKYNGTEIKLIDEFLNHKGSLEINKIYLNYLIKKLCSRKTSFFSNPILSPKFRNMFLAKLKHIIKENAYGQDLKLLNELFNKPNKSYFITQKILKQKKYPFKALNDWFKYFILAINSDIQGLDSSKHWNKADNYYSSIKDKKFKKKPNPKCWFELKGGSYKKKDDFNSSGWESLLRRAKNNNGNFYDFRHSALASLLKESGPNAS